MVASQVEAKKLKSEAKKLKSVSTVRQGNTAPRKAKEQLNRAMRLMRKPLLVALFFSFFINLLMFVSPLYMLQVYDRVLGSRNETTLISLTVLAAALLLVYAVLETLRSRVLVRAGLEFDEALGHATFEAVHRATLRMPGANHAQCLRDVDTLREFFTGAGMLTLCDAPWFPIFIIACFVLHPLYGVIALIASALTLILTLMNEWATKASLNRATQAGMQAGANASASLRNGEVIQAMGMLGVMRGIWGGHHRAVLAWQSVASDRAGSIIAITKFMRLFTQTVILGTGAYLVLHREISPGQIIAGSIFVGRAMSPIEMAVANWKGFVGARGALARLKQLFGFTDNEPERMSLPRPHGSLSVEGVVAAAPGQNTAILRGVSFALSPGDVLGVVGPSAAGKSSLARVLVGVWPIASGGIRLDGSQMAHWDPQALGKYIGYLPQDVELFSGTVAQNISRFQEIDEEEIIKAARMAGCHEMIQRLAEGYNTQIGDGGASLSGGQRQRIGLARAIFGIPAFVVLDEPNANLDSAGEEALLQAVQALSAAKTTVIIITHKLNALAIVNKILAMAEGTVQVFGARDEVLSQIMGPRVVATTPIPAQQHPSQSSKSSGAE